MSPIATGVIILTSMAAFTLSFAALALTGQATRSLRSLLALFPIALIVGATVTLLLGYRLPWPELTIAVPVAAGLMTAMLSRSLGYGLLAGLIIALVIT